MEDVLTETPPPSRFFEEDLDNFAPPSPALPSPFVVFPYPNPNPTPDLLVIAISASALALLHRIPNKILIGTVILPEIPLSGSCLGPSSRDRSIEIYSAGGAVLVAVQQAVGAERAKAVARAVVGGVAAGRVVVLDSIRRWRIAGDEAVALKLETAERTRDGGEPAVKHVEWMPAGSMVDGLGAAVMVECQMRRIKATMCATWPNRGRPSASLLVATVMKGLGLDLDGIYGEIAVSSGFDADLYT